MTIKICTKCGAGKSVDQFHKKTKAGDGLNPSCKECVGKYMAAHYQKNAEVIKEKSAKWNLENREYARAMKRAYYAKNSERFSEKAQLWANNNREKRRQIQKNYYRRHKDKIAEKTKAWMAKRMAETPELVREAGRRFQAIRRARIAEAGGEISQGWWDAIIGLFEFGTCLYCGTYDNKLTMDHWVPVSKGGKTEVGNLIPCCKSCNSRKHAMMPDDWCDVSGTSKQEIELFLRIFRESYEEENLAA